MTTEDQEGSRALNAGLKEDGQRVAHRGEPLPRIKHPHLGRIVQAEADRLATQWGRSGVDPRPDDGYTLVFGLTDDVQVGMTKVYDNGRVER